MTPPSDAPMHVAGRPGCWTDTASPRPWLASDIRAAEHNATKRDHAGNVAPELLLPIVDEAVRCRAFSAVEQRRQLQGDGCDGCARREASA